MRVLVVGAGIIGLAVADELSRRGLQVDLLEKGEAAGQEASSAAAGILSPHGEVDRPSPLLDLAQAAFQLIPETIKRLESVSGLDLRYRACGSLTLAITPDDERAHEAELAWQKKAGLRMEQLNAAQVKEMEPAVTGSIRSGIWWPQTAQVDNRQMVAAYRQVIQQQGATLHTQTAVSRFLLEKDSVIGVETNRGRFEADWVVNCAGSWANLDAALPAPIPVIPVKGQMLQFQTKSPVVQRVIQSPRAYLVQRSPEQLLVGTTLEEVGYDKTVTEAGRTAILQGVHEITSGLDSLPVQESWAGLRPGTPDGLPILGPTPWKRFLCATGHFRNGILLAPLTGRLIADWIQTGSCGLDLSPFSLTRFSPQESKRR